MKRSEHVNGVTREQGDLVILNLESISDNFDTKIDQLA